MEKRWKNSGGDILVRVSDAKNGNFSVEILHLWMENTTGCVIGAWLERWTDGGPKPQLCSIGDRLMATPYDEPGMLLEILRYGQKLAELVLESRAEEFTGKSAS